MGNKPVKGGKGKEKDTKGDLHVKYTISADEVSELLAETNFDKVEVEQLYTTFFKLVGPDGALDREQFMEGLGMLEDAGLKNMDDNPFADRLFEMLDLNSDGFVDLQEFIAGLSLLCKGTPEDKLRLSFDAFDLDGNGYISKEELSLMFKQAWVAGFKALLATHGNEELSLDELHEFAEEMADLFAVNAFETLDTNHDGKLSFDEFKEFALAQPKITATLNGFQKQIPITLS